MTPTMATLETEAMFAGWVDDARRLGGWLATHFRPARSAGGVVTAIQGDKGWPDWVLAHPDGRLVFAELKTSNGRVTPEQRAWLDALANAAMRFTSDLGSSVVAFDVCIWRPEDRPEVEAILLRGARATATRWAISRTVTPQPDRLPLEDR